MKLTKLRPHASAAASNFALCSALGSGCPLALPSCSIAYHTSQRQTPMSTSATTIVEHFVCYPALSFDAVICCQLQEALISHLKTSVFNPSKLILKVIKSFKTPNAHTDPDIYAFCALRRFFDVSQQWCARVVNTSCESRAEGASEKGRAFLT